MRRTLGVLPAALALAAGAAITNAPPGQAAAATRPSAVSYTDQAVRAYGAEHTTTLARLTTPAARAAMDRHGLRARTHWARTGADGAAGHVYVSYRNTVTGDTMTLGFCNVCDGTLHLVDQAR